MDSFNSVMETLTEDRAALSAACKDAGKDHARARKQLASVENALEEAQGLSDHQQQALTEAQQSVEETSQVGASCARLPCCRPHLQVPAAEVSEHVACPAHGLLMQPGCLITCRVGRIWHGEAACATAPA